MIDPTTIRFEATDIQADITGDLAFLTMETKEGRIARPISRIVRSRKQVGLGLLGQSSWVVRRGNSSDPSPAVAACRCRRDR
jgi:hypothetical protein